MDVEIPRTAMGMDRRVQGACLMREGGSGKNQGEYQLKRQAGEERHKRGKEGQGVY